MLLDIGPDDNISRKKCPKCGCMGNFCPHGAYKRNLVTIHDEFVITIKRVLCKSCDTSHALIPPDVVPYRAFSASFSAEIAKRWAQRESNASIERTLHIAASTRRRLLSATIRDLCMLFKASPQTVRDESRINDANAADLPYLCLRVLSHALSENVRLSSPHPQRTPWPAPST